METQNVKKCSQCGAIKPLDLYHKCSKSKDGYMAHCKSCHAQYAIRAKEKQKLFDAIKANGYEWDAEIKILEKLIVPKFKVGDRIVKRNSVRFPGRNSWIVVSINSKFYEIKLSEGIGGIGVIPISEQDDYELLPNKFDISTLVPFESKVLVREYKRDVWQPSFYGFFNQQNKWFYTTDNSVWRMCIPYNKDTKHLTGTTNDCDDFYKTW